MFTTIASRYNGGDSILLGGLGLDISFVAQVQVDLIQLVGGAGKETDPNGNTRNKTKQTKTKQKMRDTVGTGQRLK